MVNFSGKRMKTRDDLNIQMYQPELEVRVIEQQIHDLLTLPSSSPRFCNSNSNLILRAGYKTVMKNWQKFINKHDHLSTSRSKLSSGLK